MTFDLRLVWGGDYSRLTGLNPFIEFGRDGVKGPRIIDSNVSKTLLDLSNKYSYESIEGRVPFVSYVHSIRMTRR